MKNNTKESYVAQETFSVKMVFESLVCNSGAILSSWIYEDVEIHQGPDAEYATVRVSSVDGKPRQ